ncbi:MAG: SIR2 family protein [bacterium]|nr:SIR2 family protein [bacterium]
MNIKEFIANYKNHPVLFVGTGMSLRYLINSYRWNDLLRKIAYDLKGNEEYYLDIKSTCQENDRYKFEKIASILEEEFNNELKDDKNGQFKEINDIFYSNMKNDINLSRFKIYISKLLSSIEFKEEMLEELAELKKIRKNIGSIITTNYDEFIEKIFEFNPLIGNNILLSNPYGSVYKIHGCVSDIDKIIITSEDYERFIQKYELIRAQLLSLFIHNPIIFIGYNIGDENIKNILKTIFTYIEPNSADAEKIRENFLLVEYDPESDCEDISEHDIDMEGFGTIRINKIKTDNYKAIYSSLSDLHLPISAMDVRKVQDIVKEIYSGGEIRVNITEDLEALKNSDKILVIGSAKTIRYEYQNSSEMMSNYFKIIDEENMQILMLINKYNINKQQYFPVFGFSEINNEIDKIDSLKKQQIDKLKSAKDSIKSSSKSLHSTIKLIEMDGSITNSNKNNAIMWAVLEGTIGLEDIENYLREYRNKEDTNYRKLLCAYDFKKYGSA